MRDNAPPHAANATTGKEYTDSSWFGHHFSWIEIISRSRLAALTRRVFIRVAINLHPKIKFAKAKYLLAKQLTRRKYAN